MVKLGPVFVVPRLSLKTSGRVMRLEFEDWECVSTRIKLPLAGLLERVQISSEGCYFSEFVER